MADSPQHSLTSAPQSPSPNPLHSPRRPDFGRRYKVLAAGGLVLAAMAVLFVLLHDSGRDSEIVVGDTVHTIQLDVWNGAGEAKLAQRLTDFLRSRGFDVVEIGNHRDQLETTLVIDRTGNPQAAAQVANALGIPLEHVIQKIDKTLYLDVSVWIGKDYRSLEPFR